MPEFQSIQPVASVALATGWRDERNAAEDQNEIEIENILHVHLSHVV